MTNEIQFLLYQLPDEKGKVQVILKDETILGVQKAMGCACHQQTLEKYLITN